MIVELIPGFRKANIHNIPTIPRGSIISFVAKMTKKYPNNLGMLSQQSKDGDLRIDFVQVKKTGDSFEVHAIVFPAVAAADIVATHIGVSLKADNNGEILQTSCDQCSQLGKECCSHVLAFIFWLNLKTNDGDVNGMRDFWGSEAESLTEMEEATMNCYCIRDLFVCDDMRVEGDVESEPLCENDGQAFLDTVLNDMDESGLEDSVYYRHCRAVMQPHESIFVHHTLLNSAKNNVRDTNSFMQHMEDQASMGIFDSLTASSKDNYKSPVWLEAQYMRLRCSLIHYVVSRKDSIDEERILEMMLGKDRERNVEARQAAKKHKRYILKQTEKLEQKTYTECGLLFSEHYPYICAAPDGITDDHIVEIKAPKTEEEFEKYLEGRETIAPKYMAQLQIQMYLANVTRALYCVLSPTFDVNGALHYVWVMADMEFVANLLSAAEDFWKEIVFPRLKKIYFQNQIMSDCPIFN